MPRPKKSASKGTSAGRKPRVAAGSTELTLKAGDLDLTIRTSDSSLITNILQQIDPSLTAGIAVGGGKAPARRRGRGPGRPAAKRSGSSRLTKADVAASFRGANPTNMEQRILLLGLAAHKKGEKHFTTDDIKANAAEIGVSNSSIPGSLSKLKSQKAITVSKEGRRAYYTLTESGMAEASRISSGETIKKPRGRRPGRKAKAKTTSPAKPAKRRGRKPGPKPGSKRGAKKAAAAKKPGRPALTKAGKPRRKPGPKPGSKRGAKKTAAAKKPGRPALTKAGKPRRKPGPKPGSKRGAKKAAPTAPRKKAAGKASGAKKRIVARKLGGKRRKGAAPAAPAAKSEATS